MAAQLQPPSRLYRVNYGPEPLRLRDWSAAGAVDRLNRRTFGHRWDDPERQFRSLYCADSPLAAVIESLQDLLPSPSVIASLRLLQLEPGDELPPVGALPEDLFETSHLCTLQIEPGIAFADVLNEEIVSNMRVAHAHLAQTLGMKPITAGTMLSEDFELTQAIARSLYDAGFAGIYLMSKFGQPHGNWTLFEDPHLSERFRVSVTLADHPIKLTPDHPDLVEALNRFRLRLDNESLLLRYERDDVHDIGDR
ncbi:MAG TPA: RES domain-containing protein [Candidatus Acidoferrales bacterium]|nr:RES domain-containing protein [Candidatus Acidoferrales bacterium]